MAAPPDDGKDLRRLHLWQIQGVRDIVLVALVVALVWFGYALRIVTVPLLVAFGFAYLVEPLVQRLTDRGRMRRPLAVTLILVVAGLGMVVAGTLAVPVIWGQTTALIEEIRHRRFQQLLKEAEQTLPEAWREPVAKLADWLDEASKPEIPTSRGSAGADPAAPGAGSATGDGAAPAEERPDPNDVITPLPRDSGEGAALPSREGEAKSPDVIATAHEEEETRLRRIVTEQVDLELAARGLTGDRPTRVDIPFGSLFGAGVQQVLARVIDALTIIFLAFLVPFYFYFFSVSYPNAIKFMKGLVPEQRRARVTYLAREMDRAVSGFVRGRIIIAFLMGVMTAIGWKFCGVPYAITLGLAAGVLSIVPYLGFAALPLACGMLLLDQVTLPAADRMAWYWILGGPTIVFVAVQSIEGYLLTPIIAGKVTDLGPVSIFVAVLAGAALAGVYGMLLSIPAAACIKIWWREVMLPRIREWSAGRRADPLPLDNE